MNLKSEEKKHEIINMNVEKKSDKFNSLSTKELINGTDFISTSIHEYLLKKEYFNTLDSFQEEVSKKIKLNTYADSICESNLGESNLLQFMAVGKKNEFFSLWSRLIPSHIKLKEVQLQKLEFYLQMYFAIYPLLPNVIGDQKNIKEMHIKDMKSRMIEFKTYLDSKEIELSKTTEFLAYYALPFVQNPREHPAYKPLFSTDWVKELKDKIKKTIRNFIPNGNFPVLYQFFNSHIQGLSGLNPNSQNSHNGPNNPNTNNLTGDSNNNTNTAKKSNVNVNLMNKSYSNNEEKFNKLSEDYAKVKKREENSKLTLIECQKKWTNFALDILSISFELINNINKLKTGIEIPYDYTECINSKLIKYELFLKKNAEELDKSNISINKEKDKDRESLISREESNKHDFLNIYDNDKEMIINSNQPSQHNSQANSKIMNSRNQIQVKANIDKAEAEMENFNNSLLDMKIIKSILKHANRGDSFNIKINSILRELRCRISKRKLNRLKAATLYSIIYYDILESKSDNRPKTGEPINNNNSNNNKILTNLLSNPDTNLETMKILNALTNENIGRTYLLSKNSLIDEIVKVMIKQDGDTEIRQNCLGIIQKFTLRSEPQKKLIELDVIRWITTIFITEMNNISDYTLEYGLALLMNLSLRSSGRDKCEEVYKPLTNILLIHLSNESLQVRTCINGTLYSLLKRNKFRQEARAVGLEVVLKSHLENPNEQMKKQIQYIINEMNEDTEKEENYDEEFEDENYADEEEEIYEEDAIEDDSIDEETMNNHYSEMNKFLIIGDERNDKEIAIINEFVGQMQNNLRNSAVYQGNGNVDNTNTNMNSNNNNLGGRREEFDGPLRRPTTPMTNLSSTSNSQMFLMERKSVTKTKTASTKNIGKAVKGNSKNNVAKYNDIDVISTAKAFESRTKIPRSPPKP